MHPVGLEHAAAGQGLGAFPAEHGDMVRAGQELARFKGLDAVVLGDVAEPLPQRRLAVEAAHVGQADAAVVDPLDVVGDQVQQRGDVAAAEGGVEGLYDFGGGGHGDLLRFDR